VRLFHDTHFDFMGLGPLCVALSAILTVAAIVVVAVRGLNMGIEFTGGTEIQVRYAQRPDVAEVRAKLAAAGMSSQQVTTIGRPEDNEIYIRIGSRDAEAAQVTDPTAHALAALRGTLEGPPDLNITDGKQVAALVANAGVTTEQAGQIAQGVLAARRERAIFGSVDDLANIPGMTPQVVDYLKAHATVGPIALRSQSYIGPAVGRELVRNAVWAILGSLAGMLAYIWFRFEFEWGLAAVIALIHDTLMTLGFVSLFQLEVSLPVVAAFLTLIGYSVNDTVVIFDRIRENLGGQRSQDLRPLINQSVNQTLSRTVITSGLTWLVVVSLLIFGGPPLRPFSFVMTFGIIVGTYSTIYVASPILVLWRSLMARRRGAKEGARPTAPPERRSRKVRTSG
jgi:preprotein translocase subunit SecF